MNNSKMVRVVIIAIMAIVAVATIEYSFKRIGVNITESVDFTFYTHKEIKAEDITPGAYVLFDIPKNELYTDENNFMAVKRIGCMGGDSLQSKRSTDSIKYFCNNNLISTLTVFNRPNGEALQIFEYDGDIPNGYVFMLGDIAESYDSRYWGFVATDNISRKVKPIYFMKRANASDYLTTQYEGFYQYAVAEDNTTDNATDNETKFVMPVIPWEQVYTMPPKELGKLFDEVQDYALSYRTLENFDTYAQLKAVVVNRAAEFSNVATLWAQLNPEMTSESWFPTSGYGQAVYKAEASELRMNYLRQNSNDFALLYLYQDDCRFCQAQYPILQYFEDATGWRVKPVDVKKHPETMARFNAQSVPSLVLLERKTERALLLSSGLMTYEEIEERLYRTIKYLKGETNEKDYSNPIRINDKLASSPR